jgi:5-methylthioadenosine/S-adenosylhomocysteine deaminase
VRLISADWVLPVASTPIRDGAILVDRDTIAAVGSRAELGAAHPLAHAEHFADCIATPGLVNAHTHLTLTALSHVVPPLPFAQWLPRLVAAMKPWEIADHEASGVIGAEECLLSGVTVVGDIAYGAAEVASASRAGLGGVYYWELLGMPAEAVAGALAALRYPADAAAFGPRVVCGLSPHSPYTAGPGLLREVHETSERLGVPLAIHVAESQAEVDLLRHGSGPLQEVSARTALGFTPPGTTTVEYLAGLGVLSNATAVHLCYATASDIVTLAASARGGVTCPRSNRYLSNPAPRIVPMLAAGLALGVGTDSSASNDDLDLMAEVRALRTAEPELSAETLIQIATQGGARAIGVAEQFGALAPGRQADIALFAVGPTRSPAETFVSRAGRDSVCAVMSAGVWRVRDGRLLECDAEARLRAADARDRAVTALARA